jgi:DNA invertase Pin-like site-specific DNA recombinase
MKTVLYARVSTLDQTLEHQREQAQQAGFRPDLVLADHGVSGVATRLRDRPEGRRLFDVLREGDVLVVRWIDRLGRNYQDVTDTIREFIRRQICIQSGIGEKKKPAKAGLFYQWALRFKYAIPTRVQD